MLYANALHNFHQSQQNLPFQNKRSSDDFVLAVGEYVVSKGTVHKTRVNF